MLTNAITPPNVFLKAYKCRTFAVNTGTFFRLEPTATNFVHNAFDFGFSNPFPFYASDNAATLNAADPRDNGVCVVRATTKKAVIRFNKHPNAVATPFLANYSIGTDMFLPTFIGAVPDPLNAMAKDGDEIEIYGLNEIAKFFAGPLDAVFLQVPFLLTITLFE